MAIVLVISQIGMLAMAHLMTMARLVRTNRFHQSADVTTQWLAKFLHDNMKEYVTTVLLATVLGCAALAFNARTESEKRQQDVADREDKRTQEVEDANQKRVQEMADADERRRQEVDDRVRAAALVIRDQTSIARQHLLQMSHGCHGDGPATTLLAAGNSICATWWQEYRRSYMDISWNASEVLRHVREQCTRRGPDIDPLPTTGVPFTSWQASGGTIAAPNPCTLASRIVASTPPSSEPSYITDPDVGFDLVAYIDMNERRYSNLVYLCADRKELDAASALLWHNLRVLSCVTSKAIGELPATCGRLAVEPLENKPKVPTMCLLPLCDHEIVPKPPESRCRRK